MWMDDHVGCISSFERSVTGRIQADGKVCYGLRLTSYMENMIDQESSFVIQLS